MGHTDMTHSRPVALSSKRSGSETMPKRPPTSARAGVLLYAWLAFGLVLWFQTDAGTSLRPLVLFECTIAAVAAPWTVSRVAPTGFWSPANIFLVVFSLFHLGLLPFWILGIDPLLPRTEDYIWFRGELGVQSLVMVTLAIAAYTLGFLFISLLRGQESGQSAPVNRGSARRDVASDIRTLSRLGVVLTVAGVLIWFLTGLRAGGLQIFVGSYQSWLATTNSSSVLPYAYFAVGVGLGLAMLGPSRRAATIAWCTFGTYATVAFFLGLRGEVLFPLAVAASVMAFRRPMPKALLTILGGAAVLLLISAAKLIRQLGVSESTFRWADANPLAALAEVGQTLRVVSIVNSWHTQGGEPFLSGSTYYVSIARLYEGLFTPLARPSAQMDYRLFNTEIAQRSGPIGGSAVAEAFHNFGVPGLVLVFVVLGLLFAYFSQEHQGPFAMATYVVAAVQLFNHVRNSFVPVIPFFVAGMVLVTFCFLLARAMPKNHLPHEAEHSSGLQRPGPHDLSGSKA